MQIIKSADFERIAVFVQEIDTVEELSEKISTCIEDDTLISSIINHYFRDASECEKFVTQNSQAIKIVCADIDCYASSFEFVLSKEINEDDHNEMISEIDDHFSSNLRNYLDYIDVHARDYTVQTRLRLIPYDEYLARCLREADTE